MKPREVSVRIALGMILLVAAAVLSSQPAPREHVGPLPNGGFLLNSGWRLDPVGKQIPLDTLPMSTALSPDGKYLLILHGGYKPPSIAVLDAASGAELSRTPVPDGWLGLAFAPKSDRVYVGGGSKSAIYEFRLADGKLEPARTFPAAAAEKPTIKDFLGDVAFSPDGRLLYTTDLYQDMVLVINPQSGMVIQRIKTGRRPYRILVHPDGKSLFVTNWADGTLGHYDATSGSQLERVAIGAHASDMLWREGGPGEVAPGEPTWAARIFIAAANTNNVYTVAVTAAKQLSVIESINLSMTPRQPLGMTPSALGLSADAKRLFVACSDGNVAGVVNVSGERSRVEGFIPTGWYPTAVRSLSSGALIVLNGKGVRSFPNPGGPNPTKRPEPVAQGVPNPQFLARMQTGTASWIEPFTNQQLDAWTKKAMDNSPYRDARLDEPN